MTLDLPVPMAVTCPACGAVAGQPCRQNISGKVRSTPHVRRARAATARRETPDTEFPMGYMQGRGAS